MLKVGDVVLKKTDSGTTLRWLAVIDKAEPECNYYEGVELVVTTEPLQSQGSFYCCSANTSFSEEDVVAIGHVDQSVVETEATCA